MPKSDHDVLKTDIAMNDPQRPPILVRLGVRVSQPARDAARDEHRQFDRQHAVLFRQPVRELLEIHPADELHGDEVDAARLAQMIGLDDVRVDQVRDQFRLANEVVDEDLLVGEALANDFDGDALDEFTRAALLGFVNDPHSAFAQLANDLVVEVALDCKQTGHARE
jgi:hypothetical protein